MRLQRSDESTLRDFATAVPKSPRRPSRSPVGEFHRDNVERICVVRVRPMVNPFYTPGLVVPPWRQRRGATALCAADLHTSRNAGRRCGVADHARWVSPPLPDDPREVRKIRNQLIILALLGLIGAVIAMLTPG